MNIEIIEKLTQEEKIFIFKQIVKENNLFFKDRNSVRKFCNCGGWGCNFCCENHFEILSRQGGGF